MKKTLALLVITCILVTLCSGCHRIPSDPDKFEFVMTCEIEQDTVARGDRIEVNTSIQNNTNKEYVFQGYYSSFAPVPSLFTVGEDGTKYSVPIESYAITDDADTNIWTVDAGEKWNVPYFFTIPADAPAGSYTIVLANRTHSETFENVFVLDEIPAE